MIQFINCYLFKGLKKEYFRRAPNDLRLIYNNYSYSLLREKDCLRTYTYSLNCEEKSENSWLKLSKFDEIKNNAVTSFVNYRIVVVNFYDV